MPTERQIRRALASIPDDITWEWARPRLVPLFERSGAEGTSGDPTINAVAPVGVAIGFGIEIGPMFARVTQSKAERWEASVEQIETAAFEHLDRVTRTLTRRDLQHAVHNGHMLRVLPKPHGWASSVILAGEETLMRIFGGQDQVFTVPARNALLAFDSQVPARVVAEVTIGLEELDPHPLLLDPFVLSDGRLSWEGTAADDEDER